MDENKQTVLQLFAIRGSLGPSQQIRYNGRMDWDKDWTLYAAAVAVPVAIALGLWFFSVWIDG
jgi:hypothetical protein